MNNEKLFSKPIKILVVEALDFTGDNGRVQLCKIQYWGKNNDGIDKVFTLNIPYELYPKFGGKVGNINAELVFSVNDFSKKPTIVDVKVLS